MSTVRVTYRGGADGRREVLRADRRLPAAQGLDVGDPISTLDATPAPPRLKGSGVRRCRIGLISPCRRPQYHQPSMEMDLSVKPDASATSSNAAMTEVTRILSAMEQGEPHAADQLLPLVYNELRKLAAGKLARETPGQTLQATALVHEAYLRLVGGDESRAQSECWDSRGHFFAAAAEAMRRILIEQARKKGRRQQDRYELRDDDLIYLPVDEGLLDLDEALGKLAAADPQAAEIVKLRIFAGMTVEEVAQILSTSTSSVKRNWRYARAWLSRQLKSGASS